MCESIETFTNYSSRLTPTDIYCKLAVLSKSYVMKYSLKLYNFCEHRIASPFGTLSFAEVSAGYPPKKLSIIEK